MHFQKKNIHGVPSKKDADKDSEEQDPVREFKSIIIRMSFIHSTELVEEDLEVVDEEEPVFTKVMSKTKMISYFAKFDFSDLRENVE